MNRMSWLAVLVAMGLTGGVQRGVASTWYVATNGNDEADGTNWATALLTVNAGVAKAEPSDTVLVSNGTYLLNETLSLSQAIVLTSLLGRAQTVIDGNAARRCLSINHAGAVASGFTLRNGVAGTALYGGGVNIDANGGVLHDCRVTASTARNGGGVTIRNSAGHIEDCVIDGNFSLTNETWAGGGGIYLRDNGTVARCTVESNTGHGGGGIYIEGTGGTVVDSTIRANSSATNTWTGGGGIYIHATGTVARCEIANNETVNYGGGVYVYYGARPDALRIEQCVFVSNRVINASIYRYGGGIHLRGEASNVVVRNCLFAYNSAPACGGVSLNARSNTLINCTVVSNTATHLTGAPGGVQVSGAGRLLNCIVYDNDAPSNPNLSVSGATLTGGVAYCCSFPAKDMGDGPGNTTDAPLFVGAPSSDVRLTAASPCVNTGTNLNGMADETDLDGRPRLDRFSGLPDMGAYEYVPAGTLFQIK